MEEFLARLDLTTLSNMMVGAGDDFNEEEMNNRIMSQVMGKRSEATEKEEPQKKRQKN